MATRMFLRNLTAANPPTAGEKSTALPDVTLGANNAGGTDETRALKTAKGTAQTSLVKASDAQTTARDNYLCRFTSDALAVTQINANTWTIALAVSEQNTNANSFLHISLYVWRPSTNSVIGFIFDAITQLGVEWGTTEDGQVITVSGVAVTVATSDVIVLEVWRHATQGMAAAYNQTVFFDGTTDVIDTTTTDAASYIETPQDALFSQLFIRTIAETAVIISETLSRLKTAIKSISETVTSSETLARKLNAFRTIANTVTLSETLTAGRLLVRSIAEGAISILDSIARRITFVRSIPQTVIISETLARNALSFTTYTSAPITLKINQLTGKTKFKVVAVLKVSGGTGYIRLIDNSNNSIIKEITTTATVYQTLVSDDITVPSIDTTYIVKIGTNTGNTVSCSYIGLEIS